MQYEDIPDTAFSGAAIVDSGMFLLSVLFSTDRYRQMFT